MVVPSGGEHGVKVVTFIESKSKEWNQKRHGRAKDHSPSLDDNRFPRFAD